MKIVLTNKSTTIAGGENYILYLAKELISRKHEIIIAPLTNSELAIKSKELGIETIEIDYSANGLNEIPLIFAFANKLNNKRVDIIHTNSNTDRTIGAFASRILKCKNIAQIHSHFSVKERTHHFIRNRFIDHFITDSYSSKNQLINMDNISEDKVTAIHIGIPKNNYSVPEEIKNNIYEELKIKNDEFVIGAIGRLVEFKGHEYLLKAFWEVLKKHPKVKLIIVGDGELRNYLIKITKELELENKVFFTGYRTDIDNLLSIFDIFVHPSIENGGESFPISILHALRSGLPIIATKVSDIPLQVIDNSNGFIVEPKNIESLNKRISELITNKELMKKFADNSFLHFKNNFTIDKMVEKIENVYEDIKKHI